MSNKKKCERCGNTRSKVDPHHPLPRRHFGKGNKNPWTVDLCEACHRQADEITYAIEKEILREQGNKIRFIRAFQQFMGRCPIKIIP